MRAIRRFAVLVAATAVFAVSAVQSIAAYANCYLLHGKAMKSNTSGSGQSACGGLRATLRRAVFTKQLIANNSIDDRQVCLA